MNKKIYLKNMLKENIQYILNYYKPNLPIQDIIIGVDEKAINSIQFLYFLLNNYNRSMVFLDYSLNNNILVTKHDYTVELPNYKDLETIYIYENKLANIKVKDLISKLLSILKIGGSIILEFIYTNDFMDKVVMNKHIKKTPNQGTMKYKEGSGINHRIFFKNNEPKTIDNNLEQAIYIIKDYYSVDVNIIPPPMFVIKKQSIWLKITKLL